MFKNLKLKDLHHRASAVLRLPSATRPALWLLEENAVKVVIKDFSVNSRFYRNTVGRFLVWREGKALRKLAGIPGIPRFYGEVKGVALITEFISGKTLENLEKETQLDASFFIRLRELVLRCHARGVAHCDLKRAANLLLTPDGLPGIVDWGASISESEFRFRPLSSIYRRFLLDDLLAVVKMQLRHCPAFVDPTDAVRLYRRSRFERAIRRVRDRLRSYLQRVAR